MNEKNRSIKTTGELRDFLSKMMVQVHDGTLDVNQARNITKLASQINESFYSEVKVAKIRAEAGDIMPPLGAMSIGAETS